MGFGGHHRCAVRMETPPDANGDDQEGGLMGMGEAGTCVILKSQEGAQRWAFIILELREILKGELPEVSVGQGCHTYAFNLVSDYEAPSSL